MTEAPGPSDIDFGDPATYRIVVQGHIDHSYCNRLAGMTITNTERNDCATRTILVGPMLDQAELSGVLDTLYGLHLPIITVEKVDEI